MATLLGSHFVVETEKSGAPYVVRPTRPRSYLDFEKKKAAARRHYRGLTWLGRARRAGGAPGNTEFCFIIQVQKVSQNKFGEIEGLGISSGKKFLIFPKLFGTKPNDK